jgi:heptosyltransferase-2
MVLTTPLLEALAARGPVDVLATPQAAPLLANHPAVRATIVFDKRGADRGVAGFARLARRLRAGGYHTAYHAQGSLRSGALTLAARIPRRIGFSGSAGRRFYTERVTPVEGMHHAARLLSLGIGTDKASSAPLRPRLYPGAPERDAVGRLLTAAGVGQGERLIALAPGSVWATKRWPEFPALAHALRAEHPESRIVVVGGPADTALATAILEATGGAAINAAGPLSLLASAELLSRCALLVTNDSSPLHLASAMNVPTLAIFGPTVPAFGFGPLAERSVVAGRTSLACRPCHPHGPERCPLGHWRCMREITVEYLLALAGDLLTTDNL